MISPLDNLTGHNGPLTTEPVDKDEFIGLRTSGIVRLQDATNISMSLESQFDLAYNAAHAICLAALRWHGYRAKHRYIVFQVLPHTLGVGPEVWRILAKAHDTRNLGEYEGHQNLDERLVTDLITAVHSIAEKVNDLASP